MFSTAKRFAIPPCSFGMQLTAITLDTAIAEQVGERRTTRH